MVALATLDLRLLGAYLWLNVLNMLNMLNHMAFSVIGPVCSLQYLHFFSTKLVVWGLLVVPSSMDRSDGAKSVLFPSQVPKLQAAQQRERGDLLG
jgi:hypothetical protein